MKRINTCMLFAGLISAALCTIFSNKLAAADSEQAVLQTDHALQQSLGQGSKAAVAALLDANFTWIDGDGNSWGKADALDNIAALAMANQGDVDIESHNYGQMEMIIGTHHSAEFARVWVKRPSGWQLFFYMDTPASSRPTSRPAATTTNAAPRVAPPRDTDCDNPCRTLPYTPTTKMDQDIIDAWKKTKVAEWHPNFEVWEPLTADEFHLRTSGGSVNKTQRAEQIKRGQAAGTVAPPAPVSSLKIDDFGDNSAVMVAASIPPPGGKPSYTLRVWVFRDNRWQLALSQTTASRAPGVAADVR